MYNNPNFFAYSAFSPKPSLFSKIKGISFSELLNGTQKTLNIINQAIPIIYQVKPLLANAKTILRIANAINIDNDTKTNTTKKTINNEVKKETISYNEPTFFI